MTSEAKLRQFTDAEMALHFVPPVEVLRLDVDNRGEILDCDAYMGTSALACEPA